MGLHLPQLHLEGCCYYPQFISESQEDLPRKVLNPGYVSKCHPFPFEFLTSREVNFHSSPDLERQTKDQEVGVPATSVGESQERRKVHI